MKVRHPALKKIHPQKDGSTVEVYEAEVGTIHSEVGTISWTHRNEDGTIRCEGKGEYTLGNVLIAEPKK